MGHAAYSSLDSAHAISIVLVQPYGPNGRPIGAAHDAHTKRHTTKHATSERIGLRDEGMMEHT